MKHSFTDRKDAISAIANVLLADDPLRIAAAMVGMTDRHPTSEDVLAIYVSGYRETQVGSGFDGNSRRGYTSRGFGKVFGEVPVLVTRYTDGVYEVEIREKQPSASAS